MIDFGLFAVPSEKGREDIIIETRKQKSKVSPGQERGGLRNTHSEDFRNLLFESRNLSHSQLHALILFPHIPRALLWVVEKSKLKR